MGVQISAHNFKQLIKGVPKEKVFGYGPHNNPNITVLHEHDNIVVKGNFEIDENIIFKRGEVYEKEIFFDGGTYKNIIFLGGKFKKIFFRRGNFNGYVSIRGGHIENLMLLGGNFTHWLGTLDGFSNTDFNNQVLADEPLIIDRFEIEGGTYANNLWISGGTIGSLEIKTVTPVKIHCKPNDDKIYDSLNNNYTSRFTSTPRIKNLIFSRYSNKDNFYHISEIKLETIKFENFTNIGNITLTNIELEKSISFENSDLGKITFINCDFSKQTLYFDSSKITEISLAGVQLPESFNIYSVASDKLFQKRLVLGQLKKVYQNMGDNVSSNKYQAQELEIYRSTLNCSWEKFNLSLNKFSNNYGQKWESALALIIFSSGFFYILYCRTLGFYIDFSLEGFNIFLRNTGYFLEFINPIRKSEFLPKVLMNVTEDYNVSTVAIFIDSCSKLFNAYLIYQFIAAFRKHGKKSD